jgi:hypothetical protein
VTAAVPAATPVTIPVPDPIVAMPALPDVQVPPPEGSPRFVVALTHTADAPVIVNGSAFTVNVFVAAVPQPVE